ncbi:hypothetical protein Q4E93_06020 [Flavitalea sp. BT771]|uniref:hypothetical protein n=1 Tax=Flavitalea sp. BT771 TaxID=3063329 RepID=UPI0026E28260|nr:hypothetical protein [Flavitalea sp. BT771]MDO6430131.1 hypothetical protein [Flavitalea sp. BT771]MDV6219730.1 hypothetical protein [Flavitalea sp. BT771]
MDSISLPVVHPTHEKLRHSGRWLHAAAGLLILTHALSHFHRQESPPLYFWCQLLISLDIFILVMAGQDLLLQPRVNLFFRLVEIIFFLGIGLIMLLAGNWLTAIVHLSLSVAYSYLFYCERGLRRQALLSLHHIGITVPGMPESRFFLWTHINDIEACYDSIRISTADRQELDFPLQKNLTFAELEQIHEFCRHYLGKC